MNASLRRTAASLLVSVSLVACIGEQGGSPTSSSSGAGGGASTGGAGGAGGQGGQGGGIQIGCTPACADTQICSAAGPCIDKGTCLVDADCNAGQVCDPAAKTCVLGSGCGVTGTTATPVPPNLLLVLDRSCSMAQKVAGTPKWTLAVNAIRKMTADFEGKIRFGLTMFPDLVTFACGQGAIPIPVASDNETKIQSLLKAALSSSNANYPKGPCSTNIDAAMDQASSEPAFLDTSRPSYALLITDGIQSTDCSAKGGDAGTKQIITDLRQTRKVGTFVLGFGSEVDPVQLNAFADAGGLPSGDPTTHYYRVADAASLEAAFTKIATQTLSCTLTLGSAPADPTQMAVYAAGSADPISRDPTHATGWDYDAASNQITFYGATCDAFKAGTVKDVHVVFGCGGPS